MKNAEDKTELRHGFAVNKCDERIIFRGEVDYTCAVCIRVCVCAKKHDEKIFSKVSEILSVLRNITRCEAMGTPNEFHGVFGYSREELRDISHEPKKFLGCPHLFPGADASELLSELNFLRVQIRRCECAASKALAAHGDDFNESIINTLNALSSAAYILMLEVNNKQRL